MANKKLFGLTLTYNLDDNITKQQWGSVPHFRQSPTLPATRDYTYTYDALSRLTAATFTGGANENFNLSNLSYDLNGNIKTLTRRVQTPTLGNNNTEDDLQYAYTANSNRLRNVFDAGSATPNNPKKSQYFTDRNPSTTIDDYTYDTAGNLTQDKNRDISSISYNALGLPQKITLPTGSIYYYYTGGGDKLRKKGAYLPSNPTTQGGTVTIQQVKLDYLAAGVYRDDALSFIPTAEGRYIPPSPQAPGRIRFVGSYEYQQTDHRSVEPFGNLRTACQCGIKLDVATNTLVPVLVTENPITLVQENHYDPWGLNLADIETTTALGFDWWQYNAQSEKSYLSDGSFDYDTDFRGYDPQIGRFKGVDALADKYSGISGYQFGFNNPISFADPTGLEGIMPFGMLNKGYANLFAQGGYALGITSGPISGLLSKGLQLLTTALGQTLTNINSITGTPTFNSSNIANPAFMMSLGSNLAKNTANRLEDSYGQNFATGAVQGAADMVADPKATAQGLWMGGVNKIKLTYTSLQTGNYLNAAYNASSLPETMAIAQGGLSFGKKLWNGDSHAWGYSTATVLGAVAGGGGKVPNPFGKLGDPITRNTIKHIEADLRAMGFNNIVYERKFDVSNSSWFGKTKRFADIITDPHPVTGEVPVINVGKTMQNKFGRQRPISRERKAGIDILKSPDFKSNYKFYFVEKGSKGFLPL